MEASAGFGAMRSIELRHWPRGPTSLLSHLHQHDFTTKRCPATSSHLELQTDQSSRPIGSHVDHPANTQRCAQGWPQGLFLSMQFWSGISQANNSAAGLVAVVGTYLTNRPDQLISRRIDLAMSLLTTWGGLLPAASISSWVWVPVGGLLGGGAMADGM